MKPGDLVFWDDDKFGRHHFWRIETVLLGGCGQEDLIRIAPLSHTAGQNEEGERQHSTLVPECLIRGRVYSIGAK